MLPSVASPALAAAAALVGLALGISNGAYDPAALALVTVAAALVAAAAFAPGALGRIPWRPEGVAAGILGAGLAASFAFDAVVLPGVYVDPAELGPFRPVVLAAAALAATSAWRSAPAWLARARFPAIVLCWVVLAGLVLHASPAPVIDVWTIQQAGARALWNGVDPYTVAYRNPYPPDVSFLSREVLSADGRFIRAYPYPPLVLLAGLPAFLLGGDVRILFLAATALAALLVHRVGGQGRLGELAATLLLFQPRSLFVIEQSWTEPLVLVTVCAVAWTVARQGLNPTPPRGWIAVGVACGIAVASKQYAPLVVLPFWLAVAPRDRWRAAALGTALVALTYVPFLAWDSQGFLRGVVRFQLLQPFREDALSWLAAVVRAGGPRLPPWPAFVVAGFAAVLAARRVASVAEALAAGALAWLLLVLGSKQAFCNYFWLAAGLLCAAVAATHVPPQVASMARQAGPADHG